MCLEKSDTLIDFKECDENSLSTIASYEKLMITPIQERKVMYTK